MGGGWGGYVAGLMWSPGFAALLTCRLLGRNLKTFGWSWGSGRYETIAYFIPLAYSAVIYGFVWLTGLGTFFNKELVAKVTQSFGLGPLPDWLSITLYFLFTAKFAVIRDTATVIGEEIGWRGFLVPELAKNRRFAATAAITGLIWAVWHYPIVLFADYKSDTPVWFYLPLLTINPSSIHSPFTTRTRTMSPMSSALAFSFSRSSWHSFSGDEGARSKEIAYRRVSTARASLWTRAAIISHNCA